MAIPPNAFERNLSRMLSFLNRPWKIVLLFNAVVLVATLFVMRTTGQVNVPAVLFIIGLSTGIGYVLARILFAYRDVQRDRNEQLLRMNEELEARYKDMEAFSYSVAHDLKTPLATILGYTYLMRKHAGRPETDLVEIAGDIEDSAIKMGQIIDEILVLANVGLAKVAFVPLQMDTILNSAVKRLEKMIADTGASFSMPQAWPEALGYAPWIEEVWVNYISNAVKYGGSPPRLELGYEKMPGQVKYYVCDNGKGIAAADQARLFTEFTRLPESGSDGHGLGLAIVRRVLDKLGGAYGVESTPGQGSKFYFCLPEA